MTHLPAISPSIRQRALERAEEVGPNQAARELGLNEATVRGWRSKAGKTAPRAGEDLASWADRKEAAAQQAWDGAAEALVRTRHFLSKGQAANARASSIAFGILTDKAEMLDQAVANARERDKRVAPALAQTLAQILRRVLDDPTLGLTADQKRMALPLLADEFRAQDRKESP